MTDSQRAGWAYAMLIAATCWKRLDRSVLVVWVVARICTATHPALSQKYGLITESPVKGDPMQDRIWRSSTNRRRSCLKAASELGFSPTRDPGCRWWRR